MGSLPGALPAPGCPACRLRAKGWEKFQARCIGQEEDGVRAQRYRDLVSRMTAAGYTFDEVGAELALHHDFHRARAAFKALDEAGGL